MKFKLLAFEFLGESYTINNEYNIKISWIETICKNKKIKKNTPYAN